MKYIKLLLLITLIIFTKNIYAQGFSGQLCPQEQQLTQNLRTGGYNGKYDNYTHGIVKEAHILQAHLNRLGFASGKVDGKLGPISDGAIKRMQKYLGVKVDGYVGPITRNALNHSCNEKENILTVNSQNIKLDSDLKEYLDRKIQEIQEKAQKKNQEKIKNGNDVDIAASSFRDFISSVMQIQLISTVVERAQEIPHLSKEKLDEQQKMFVQKINEDKNKMLSDYELENSISGNFYESFNHENRTKIKTILKNFDKKVEDYFNSEKDYFNHKITRDIFLEKTTSLFSELSDMYSLFMEIITEEQKPKIEEIRKKARIKANDAAAKAKTSEGRSFAVLYFYENNTYKGAMNHSETLSLNNDVHYELKFNTYGDAYYTYFTKMKSEDVYFCVDSNGFVGEIDSNKTAKRGKSCE